MQKMDEALPNGVLRKTLQTMDETMPNGLL
jgi:hypothetical protein